MLLGHACDQMGTELLCFETMWQCLTVVGLNRQRNWAWVTKTAE
jgi:hypothetical protein